jgi:hypothetical protein
MAVGDLTGERLDPAPETQAYVGLQQRALSAASDETPPVQRNFRHLGLMSE